MRRSCYRAQLYIPTIIKLLHSILSVFVCDARCVTCLYMSFIYVIVISLFCMRGDKYILSARMQICFIIIKLIFFR